MIRADRDAGGDRGAAHREQVDGVDAATRAVGEREQPAVAPRGRSRSTQPSAAGRRRSRAAFQNSAWASGCGSAGAISSGPLLSTLFTAVPTGRSSRCSPRASSHGASRSAGSSTSGSSQRAQDVVGQHERHPVVDVVQRAL